MLLGLLCEVLGTSRRWQLLGNLALGDRSNTDVTLRLVLELGKVILDLLS